MKSEKVFEGRLVKNKQGEEILDIRFDANIKKDVVFEIDLKEVNFTKVKMGVMYGGKDQIFLKK